MENVELKDGHYLCKLLFCRPEKISKDGLVTMKSGIMLKEGMAKEQDVIEYSEHPFVGEVIKAGNGCFAKVGEFLLLPSRLAKRMDSLDHIIINNTDYHLLNDSLCVCKKTTVDKSLYANLGEQ